MCFIHQRNWQGLLLIATHSVEYSCNELPLSINIQLIPLGLMVPIKSFLLHFSNPLLLYLWNVAVNQFYERYDNIFKRVITQLLRYSCHLSANVPHNDMMKEFTWLSMSAALLWPTAEPVEKRRCNCHWATRRGQGVSQGLTPEWLLLLQNFIFHLLINGFKFSVHSC